MDEIRVSYDTPTQVAFWDPDGNHYVGGIAWGSDIICGCCGGVFAIDEVLNDAPEGVKAIIDYQDWVDISIDIMGDDEISFIAPENC